MKMNDSFQDPESKETLEKIYKEIQEIKSGDEAYAFVKKYAPNWIVDEADDYAKEYKTFKKNWRKIYEMTRQSKRKILLVSKIMFKEQDPEKKYTILQMLCEILTRAGYCVRRRGEFVKCERCGLAIMSKEAEENNGQEQKYYTPYCKGCNDYLGKYW